MIVNVLNLLILKNLIEIPNMIYMFYKCSSLKELNLSKFNTNNVTNMFYMFGECSALEELNLLNFNNTNVTNMNYIIIYILMIIEKK